MLSRHKGQNFGSTCKIHSQQTYDIKEATSACYLPISDGKWYRLPNPIALSDTMNTVRRLNSNMECFAATVPLFGLHKSSVPTENHFCVKLQWVRWLSQCSEKSSWNEIGQNNWTYFQKGLCYEFEGFLVGKSLQYCIKQWTFKVQRLNWFWLKVNRFYLLRVLVSLEIIGTVWVSIAYLA